MLSLFLKNDTRLSKQDTIDLRGQTIYDAYLPFLRNHTHSLVKCGIPVDKRFARMRVVNLEYLVRKVLKIEVV